MDVKVFNTNPNARRPYIVEVDGDIVRETHSRFNYDAGTQQIPRIARFRTIDKAKSFVSKHYGPVEDEMIRVYG